MILHLLLWTIYYPDTATATGTAAAAVVMCNLLLPTAPAAVMCNLLLLPRRSQPDQQGSMLLGEGPLWTLGRVPSGPLAEGPLWKP